MKIVELITFLGSGGAERFVVDLSNELAKRNEVYLVTILDDTKDSEVRNFYRFDVSDQVHYVNLGLPNGAKLSSQWKVYDALRKLNPDVIHVHMVPSLKYSALAIALLALRKKIILTVHNDLHNGYDKGLFKVFCDTYGRKGYFKLACLSEKNYNDFKAFYPKTNLRHIDNGRAPLIPTEKFTKVKEEMDQFRHDKSSQLLIHIARCNPVKNQKLLVTAVNELAAEGFNIDLVVIGAGFDSPEGKQIKSLAREHVHFIGTRKNVADYMLNADIFCLSSDFEGMPITLLEAGLAGVPAVSTPVCGAVDLIQDGVNGYLSKSHLLEDYKAALIKAIDNYDTIKANAMSMKDNSPYTIAECAKKYEEYFKE